MAGGALRRVARVTSAGSSMRARCPAPSSSGSGTGSPTAGHGSARRRPAGCVRTARRRRRPGPPTAAPGCTGAAGARRCRSRSPISTILPRYITATRWQKCRTTARSCAMNTNARPSSRCSARSRLMTCAWIDTSSAETGSSATISFGLSGQRAGDADALALAAGELVRIAVVVLRVQPDQSPAAPAPASSPRRAAGSR